MDKKTISAFVLIGLVLIGWLYWTSSQQQKLQPQKQNDTTSQVVTQTDTSATTTQNLKSNTDTITIRQDTIKNDSLKKDFSTYSNEFGSQFYNKSIKFQTDINALQRKNIIIENEVAIMEFTDFGGTLEKYTTKKFNTWDGVPVQLVDWKRGKELHLIFTSKDGKLVNTRDLVFSSTYSEWQKVDLTKDSSFKLTYVLNIDSAGSQQIKVTYTFFKNSYEFDAQYEFVNSNLFIADAKYQLVWGSSLNLTEFRSTEEASFEQAYAYMGAELADLDAEDFNQEYKADYNGNTDYVATRNKYFGIFLIPESRKGDGAYLTGYKIPLKDEGLRKEYSIALKMDIKNDKVNSDKFIILLTPIDYNILKSYDRELQLVNRFPLDFIVRPIAQWFIIPFFTFLHNFIPNYGVVIIIFALVLKILLNPLTKKQMDSMKRLGELSPKMTAIREKFKDDPVKMNEQIMKMYKEEKINPMGGCIPMLLQLPILYALFAVFSSTIELRQQPFILWITDLAAPDVIFNLPFKIPLFGIDQVSGLATLMGITMFIQQKMTVTDPKQKALVFIMPIMLTLLFFSFPSGLNLYYFTFNLLSIIQQYYDKKYKKPKDFTKGTNTGEVKNVSFQEVKNKFQKKKK
ncbi:MAG TPA: membrane protein insertase YidC [Ignavibacteria bacterium]|nr:membrane protein insertase YidC [Ignavibacteria bacterium]